MYWKSRDDLVDSGECRFAAPIVSETEERWPTTRHTDSCAIHPLNNEPANASRWTKFFAEKVGIDLPIGFSGAVLYDALNKKIETNEINNAISIDKIGVQWFNELKKNNPKYDVSGVRLDELMTYKDYFWSIVIEHSIKMVISNGGKIVSDKYNYNDTEEIAIVKLDNKLCNLLIKSYANQGLPPQMVFQQFYVHLKSVTKNFSIDPDFDFPV